MLILYLIQKLELRKAALGRTTAINEERKGKWKEVLVPSFISSEESGEDEDDRPVLYVKKLPWRSHSVTKFFQQLDHKANKNKSKRALLQTLPRVPGRLSQRTKPVTEFDSAHWGYA